MAVDSDLRSPRAATLRLGLPEWLTEQVDSGKHQGVIWVDYEQRIFKVPWKHASRNGWESKDVSLFKAWAIYTGRFREGVDAPRPALWKTNFRCAVNSHSSLKFLPEHSHKTGDKAHRVIKIVDGPGKKNRRTVGIQAEEHEITKAVTIKQVGSCFSETSGAFVSPVKFPSELRLSPSSLLATCSSPSIGICAPSLGESKFFSKDHCNACSEYKESYRTALYKAFTGPDSSPSDNYMLVRNRYLDIMASDHHVCKIEHPVDELMKTFLGDESVSKNVLPLKADIQFLYHVGKALQDGHSGVSTSENESSYIDSRKDHVLGVQNVSGNASEGTLAPMSMFSPDASAFKGLMVHDYHGLSPTYRAEDKNALPFHSDRFEISNCIISIIDDEDDDAIDSTDSFYIDDEDIDEDDNNLIVPRQ